MCQTLSWMLNYNLQLMRVLWRFFFWLEKKKVAMPLFPAFCLASYQHTPQKHCPGLGLMWNSANLHSCRTRKSYFYMHGWLRFLSVHVCLLSLTGWEMRIVIIEIISFTAHTQWNKTSSWSLTKNFRKDSVSYIVKRFLRGRLGNGILLIFYSIIFTHLLHFHTFCT